MADETRAGAWLGESAVSLFCCKRLVVVGGCVWKHAEGGGGGMKECQRPTRPCPSRAAAIGQWRDGRPGRRVYRTVWPGVDWPAGASIEGSCNDQLPRFVHALAEWRKQTITVSQTSARQPSTRARPQGAAFDGVRQESGLKARAPTEVGSIESCRDYLI